jgi:hypothetical protein
MKRDALDEEKALKLRRNDVLGSGFVVTNPFDP